MSHEPGCKPGGACRWDCDRAATCPCTVNPDPHGCVWVLPWQAGALVIRPIQTIHTWRKAGHISSRRDPETGLWQVCNCEALTRAENTATRWRRAV